LLAQILIFLTSRPSHIHMIECSPDG